MPTKTFTTICPCFPGFYESYLSFDGDREQTFIDNLAEYWDFPQKLLNAYFRDHDLDFKRDEYMAEVSQVYCDYVAEELHNWLLNGAVATFVEVRSPRYYNFETDQVIMNIKLDPKDVIHQCREHYEDFKKYLDEHFTPRSGFIPFYGTNPEWWLDVDNWSETIVLGTILDFILRFHVQDPEWHFSELTMEQVDLDEFISLPENAAKWFEDYDEAEEISREYARLMHQGDLYLDIMRDQNPDDWEKYVPEVHRGKERMLHELTEELAEKIAAYAS